MSESWWRLTVKDGIISLVADCRLLRRPLPLWALSTNLLTFAEKAMPLRSTVLVIGFTANMVEPTFSPLIAFPKAWSPSTPKTIRGEPILFDAAKEEDLEKFQGNLHRKIVLLSSAREVKALFDPPAKRQSDTALLAL